MSAKNTTKYSNYKWSRPTDWLTVPEISSSEQKVYLLQAIFNHANNYVAFTCAGNYTVDWGDGNAENVSSGVKAQHLYDYSTISAGTLSTRGYKQVLITITPQSGQNLTSMDLQQRHSALSTYTLSYLEIAVRGPSLTTMKIGSGGSTDWSEAGIRHTTLEKVTIYSSGVTGFTALFNNCISLKEVNFLYNTSGVTSINNMFVGCWSLIKAPFFNTQNVTDSNRMFVNCYTLKDVPNYNLSSSINSYLMFQNCYSLISVPGLKFKTNGDCNLGGIFANCYSLTTIHEDFGQSAGTGTIFFDDSNAGGFSGCYSLQYIPERMFSKINTTTKTQGMRSLFNSCQSLKTIPFFDTAIQINGSSFFGNCAQLTKIPAYDFRATTSVSNIFTGCYSLQEVLCYGLKNTHTYSSSNNLSKAALEVIFENLGSPATTQTLTISSTAGAGLNPIVSLSSNTTTGSNTITMASTTGLLVGMQATGTGLTGVRGVTFTDAGDTVNYTAHGIPNGKRVSFSSITSTTGIVVYTLYYVINATADTFQLSLTNGGSAIALTTNGSGNILIQPLITAIVPNTSITIDIPAVSTANSTLTYRNLNTQIAVQKNWAVTG